MSYEVKFYSETGWILGVNVYDGESEKKVIKKVEADISDSNTIHAFPYGESIGLGTIIITSKIACFTVSERK